VTIATIQAQLRDVVFVTEGNWLRSFIIYISDIRRKIDGVRHIPPDGEQKNSAVNTDARDRVRAAMKDLSHTNRARSLSAACSPLSLEAISLPTFRGWALLQSLWMLPNAATNACAPIQSSALLFCSSRRQ
jgi:hypothetical protein